MIRLSPRSTLFPYTTLFRSLEAGGTRRLGNESFFSAPQLKRDPLGGASRRDRGYRNVERRSLVPRPDIQEPPFRSGTRTAWNRNRLAVRGFAFSLPRLQRPLSPRSWSQLRRDWVARPSPRLSEHGGPWRCTCRAASTLGSSLAWRTSTRLYHCGPMLVSSLPIARA